MKNELLKLYNGMIDGEKILIVLSTGLEMYVDFRDVVGKNNDNIIIIHPNGVKTVLNPNHIIMVSLILPRRWLSMDKKPKRLYKTQAWQDYLIDYGNVFYVFACLFVSLVIVVLFVFACAYFNVSFTESGMIRNFLMGGV